MCHQGKTQATSAQTVSWEDATCETTVLFQASPTLSSPAPSFTALIHPPPTKTFLPHLTLLPPPALEQPLPPTFRQLLELGTHKSPLLLLQAPQGEVELLTDLP